VAEAGGRQIEIRKRGCWTHVELGRQLVLDVLGDELFGEEELESTVRGERHGYAGGED
jgi:hypothetical protein